MKTAQQWFDHFNAKDLKECMLQAECIRYNSPAFGIGLKKAIYKKKKNGETLYTPKVQIATKKIETDSDILAGTHEWVSENIETGAGKGARQTVIVKRRKLCEV